MASGYLYRGGPWELDTSTTTASTAIAVLDALMASSGALLVLTTGNKAEGVALESKALADTATTAKQFIMPMAGRTKWFAVVKAGSLASTEVKSFVDLSGTTGAMGLAADTTTNNDYYIHKVISTGTSGTAIVKFPDPAYYNATN